MKNTDTLLPVGFFDSGVGGISVLKQTLAILPGENYIYYGDSGNLPYGNKSESEIKALSLDCGAFLYEKGVKAIVIACNTATSIAVHMMRDLYQIPVISIEPAVKPAIEAMGDGYVIVMATPATIQQERYNSLLAHLGHTDRIINVSCENLAQMIETLDLDSPRIKAYICEKLIPYKDKKIDGIVLGCTHYSFICGLIGQTAQEIFSGKCEIFDGKYGTARQLKRVLEEMNLINLSGQEPTLSLYSSGSDD
ncbi:MAG: glutamate racemase, partial [Eubacteriales bacterium]